MTTETVLTESQITSIHHKSAVGEFDQIELCRAIEQAVLQSLEIVAWRYKTPTGWHATTDAARALAIKDHHDVEPLFAKRAAPITKKS